MRISLNWLKKYVKIAVSDDELIRLIGARLVEVEGVIDERKKYDNIYIARVEVAERIPETHLTLCQINVGNVEIPKVFKNENGLVQVVCGAPNVREGMLAVWIAPGAIVPASVNEDAPFVIGKRVMLGKYESNGMLAGADELDFDNKHEKIAEIDPRMAEPGQLLADVFDLDDLILEIENKSLTHRPDCFGIIGFAREVAGILGQKFEEPEFLYHENVFPEGFLIEGKDGCIKSKDCDIDIEIVDSKICPRYTCALIKVGDAIYQNKYLSNTDILLAKAGMQSVSKIVDVTNILMLLTGQPLHAFDYDKFVNVGGSETPKIIVRLADDKEKLELLDGKVVECAPSDILITSNNVPVALAGAMGGKNTEIDETTKRVLLESASFSLYNLRKTQMIHGIFSEAITRFTKGVPTSGTFNVLAEAVKEIGGRPVALNDAHGDISGVQKIDITSEEINALLGTDYQKELIIKTLENVGFRVEQNGDVLSIYVPTWRTDIHIKEDICEEVGRLLGYDNIIPTLPLHATAEPNRSLGLKKRVRDIMKMFGANELLTYSFVSERLLEKANLDSKNSYKIVNSISPDLQYVRQTIVPSLLDKAYVNQKIPFDKFALYEINKVYQKGWGLNDENVPVERMHMGFLVAERKNNQTAYYKAKFYLDKLLDEFGIRAEYVQIKKECAESRPFERKRAAEVWAQGVLLGYVGEFKQSVRRDFKLAEFLAGFEIDFDELLKLVKDVKKVGNFEVKDKQDLTVVTNESYAEVLDEVQKENPGAAISPVGIYCPDDSDKKHITFHLEFY